MGTPDRPDDLSTCQMKDGRRTLRLVETGLVAALIWAGGQILLLHASIPWSIFLGLLVGIGMTAVLEILGRRGE